MNLNSFRVEVQKLTEVAEEVIEIRCKLIEPKNIEFKAGQFLMLNVPSEEGKIVKRAYSIGNAPDEGEGLVFVVKLLPDGKASNFIRKMNIGDELKFDGPLGHFYLQPEHDKDMLFVGTGTGIAPLRSMIMQNIKEGQSHKMHLFFGVRSEKDVFWDDEFSELAKEHDNFNYVQTLSQPTGDWDGYKGRVTEHIKRLELNASEIQVYLCGSMAMVNEVSEMLLEKGIAKEDIKKEIY